VSLLLPADMMASLKSVLPMILLTAFLLGSVSALLPSPDGEFAILQYYCCSLAVLLTLQQLRIKQAWYPSDIAI